VVGLSVGGGLLCAVAIVAAAVSNWCFILSKAGGGGDVEAPSGVEEETEGSPPAHGIVVDGEMTEPCGEDEEGTTGRVSRLRLRVGDLTPPPAMSTLPYGNELPSGTRSPGSGSMSTEPHSNEPFGHWWGTKEDTPSKEGPAAV